MTVRGGSILVLNSGSSSLKFGLYAKTGEGWRPRVKGKLDGIGASPRLTAKDERGETLEEGPVEHGVRQGGGAIDHLAGWLAARFPGERPIGVGHRVVHGGALHRGPAVVTPALVEDLRALIPLAPLHQPHSLAGIESAADHFPGVPQVACFDTSFHRGRPAVADLVPLPEEIRRASGGIQRYGFHGLSYEYIASTLAEAAPEIAGGRVIVAHLGSGASLCALEAGRSVDTTMGFTPLDGLCMGTRPGALDPGVVLHLFQALGYSAADVEKTLYERSGLLGLSGLSGDMRELLDAATPAARTAVDYYVYRAAKEVGALAAVLGGIDGLVFTAGIGENSAPIRERIAKASRWLGIELDSRANAEGGPRISRPGSAASAWVIPTDEERMIARHTGTLLGSSESEREDASDRM